MRKFVDQRRFRELAERGDAAGVGVQLPSRLLRAGGGDPSGDSVVQFVLSDGSVDRMGDRIDPAGWTLTAYRKNPVVLWAHDALAPPIGRMHNIFSDGARLIGDVEFATAEVYPFAATICRMVKAGYINAGSVGFAPLEYSLANDPERPFGIDFHRQELLEFSIVPLPANQNALAQACAKGVLGYRDAELIGKGPTHADRIRRLAELRPNTGVFDISSCDPEAETACAAARAVAAVVIQGYGRH
jgi:HK97 family phage prohead protease